MSPHLHDSLPLRLPVGRHVCKGLCGWGTQQLSLGRLVLCLHSVVVLNLDALWTNLIQAVSQVRCLRSGCAPWPCEPELEGQGSWGAFGIAQMDCYRSSAEHVSPQNSSVFVQIHWWRILAGLIGQLRFA